MKFEYISFFLKMHIKTRYDSINVEWLSFVFCKLYSKYSNIYIIIYLEYYIIDCIILYLEYCMENILTKSCRYFAISNLV